MNMSSSSQNEYALWWQAFSIYSLVIAKVELVLMGLSLGNVITYLCLPINLTGFLEHLTLAE